MSNWGDSMQDRRKNAYVAIKKGTATTNVPDIIPVFSGRTVTVDANGDLCYATCMEILAKTLAQVEWAAYGRDNKEAETINSKYHRILNLSPWPGINAYDFWHYMEIQRQGTGNAFAYIHKDGLIPLNSDFMTMYVDDSDVLKKFKIIYEYKTRENGSYTLLPEEVLHFKANSANGYEGRGALRIMTATLQSNAEVESAMRGAVVNGFNGTMLLKFTSDLNEQRKKMLQDRIAERLKDAKSKFLLLPAGMDATNVANDIRAYHETLKKTNAEAISAFFGIPLSMLNIGTGSGMAGFSTNQLTQFFNLITAPRIKQYSNELSLKLLGQRQQNSGYRFDSSNDAFDFLDAQARASVLTSLVGGGVIVPNEARASLKYPASDDPLANKLNFRGGSGSIGDGAGGKGEGGRPNGS